jgi:hypothetical protein
MTGMASRYPIRVQSRGRLFGMGHLWRQGAAKLCQSPSRVRDPPQRGLRRDCNGGRLACEHSAPLAITPRLSVRPPDGHIRLMKVRAAESDVVKFLRTALADGAHYGNCRATKSRRLGRSGKRHHHIVFQAIGLRGLLA